MEKPNENWIQTYTGRKVYPLGDFKPSDVDILDIARALSNTCRWGGHCRKFYSVAEHSIYVSELVPENLALAGLLHDAAEAYLGDIPTPLKELLPEITDAEAVIMDAIIKKFEIHITLSDNIVINEVDKMLQVCEVGQLMPDLEMFQDYRWGIEHGGKPVSKHIMCYHPNIAELLFINRYRALTGVKDQRVLRVP